MGAVGERATEESEGATGKRRGPEGGGGRVSGEERTKSVAVIFASHGL